MNKEDFLKQLSFSPQFEGGSSKSFQYDNIIVGGVGGSALPARILFFLNPVFPLWLHDDYDLPDKHDLKTLFVAISYSGETRETLSFATKALENNLPLAVISSGGALAALARKHDLPRVIVPEGFQPRQAVLSMLRALFFITGHHNLMKELENAEVDFEALVEEGEDVGMRLDNNIPLVYASRRNEVLSHIWKIMFNENGKIPAFANVFPEVAHNEIEGLVPARAGESAKTLKPLLLFDSEDDERVRRSMEVFLKMALENSIETETLKLPSGKVAKLLFTFILSSAASRALAKKRGVDPEAVPFIESFKKSLWPK